MAQTQLTHMIDPEVMADMISYELENAIRFAPLADVDTTLVGRPGSTLSVPAFTYIGDAEDVAEGQPIPLDQLGTETKEMSIKKAGKGVEITDEAILSGLGDPLGEAVRQLRLAITNKVDNDLITVLEGATQTATGDVTTIEGLQGAIDIFSDEDQEPMVLLVNPADASKLATEARQIMVGSEVGANTLINGTYLDVLGAQVVRTNKLVAGTAYLVKRGALKLVLKRDVMVEADRDIINKTTVVTADEHYGVYLYNDAKVIKFGVGA